MPAAAKCPGCRYDLSGLPTPICPECGLDAEMWYRAKLEAASAAQSAAVVSLCVLVAFVAGATLVVHLNLSSGVTLLSILVSAFAFVWASAALLLVTLFAKPLGEMAGARYVGVIAGCTGPLAMLVLFAYLARG